MAKRRITVEIDAALADRAQEAGLDLSQVVHAALTEALTTGLSEQGAPFDAQPDSDRRARRWAEENAEAIGEHNQRIADRGLIASEWRRW